MKKKHCNPRWASEEKDREYTISLVQIHPKRGKKIEHGVEERTLEMDKWEEGIHNEEGKDELTLLAAVDGVNAVKPIVFSVLSTDQMQ